MIRYRTEGLQFFLKIFQWKGSVFPRAATVALPCGIFAALLKLGIGNHQSIIDGQEGIMQEAAVWSGFSFFVGFLIVFRTSESYGRYCEGCTFLYRMRAEWYDACSALLAFCKMARANDELVDAFQGRLLRLFSMLHASALAAIQEESFGLPEAYHFELIDPLGIDSTSLQTLMESSAKPELLLQWIQQLIVENIETGVLSIPPPILSRCFQENANGMNAFHDAMKMSYIQFPFPYAQTCDVLLIIHFSVIPFVVSQWVSHFGWAALFTFIQVFTLWSLNFIAVEIENPFGMDANDIDARHLHETFNEHLLMLVKPATWRTPELSALASDLKSESSVAQSSTGGAALFRASFDAAWAQLPEAGKTCGGRHSRTTRSVADRQLRAATAPLLAAGGTVRAEELFHGSAGAAASAAASDTDAPPSDLWLPARSRSRRALSAERRPEPEADAVGRETDRGAESPKRSKPSLRPGQRRPGGDAAITLGGQDGFITPLGIGARGADHANGFHMPPEHSSESTCPLSPVSLTRGSRREAAGKHAVSPPRIIRAGVDGFTSSTAAANSV